MTWIDYKKAYDIVSQSWIVNCVKMQKKNTRKKTKKKTKKTQSDEVINFIEKTMKTWKEKFSWSEDP